MQIEKFNKLLARYSNGEANETEKALVEAWYKSYDSQEYDIEVDLEMKKRAHLLFQTHLDSKTRTVTSNVGMFLKIAASISLLAIAGALSYYFTNLAKDEYLTTTSEGATVNKLNLPDGSVVWLKPNTTVRSQKTFGHDLREVYIEEGEAFFEIKPNAAKPFVVHTPNLDVKVLGTSFNVQAYDTIEDVMVTVATGKVGVSIEKTPIAKLTPGLQLRYNKKSGIYHQYSVNVTTVTAWRHGDIYLRQASFETLAQAIEKIYGLKLIPGNAAVKNHHFTLRISPVVSVDETMLLIQSIHNTEIRREGNEVVLY